MPNDWYKGKITLDDTLFTINLATGDATLLEVVSEETGQSIDIVDLVPDNTKTRFVFTNKNTRYLWLYDPT
jgi:hypothetical protein